MDHETTELSRERAVSSEPCSTRANPYNNDDSSSRKRQRVSRGDSRSRSEETNGESSSAPPSTPPQDEERTKIELDTAPPHTPSRIQRDFPPPEPTSSRVTINLRTQRALEDIPSSPVSPPTPSKMVSGGEDSGTRVSVESESDALSTVPPIETPSSSPSPSGSPTIELIQISEDDAEYEEISPAVFDGSPVTGDPIFDFPYLENQSLVDAVRKIARFFQCEDVGDDVVFCRLRDWMIKMMKYADGSRRLYEHFTNHREFWLAFPEIFWGLNQRRQVSSCSSPGTLIDTVFSNSRFFGNFLQRNQPARRALSEMFHQLARLVGRFVAMDVMTLTYHSQKAGIEQEPDLGSRHMLEILAWLFFRKDDQQHIGRNLDAHYHWSWDSELSKMTQYFQDEGGAIPRLTRFVRGHLFLLDKYPKLVENLAVPTRFVGKFVVEEAYILENSPLRQYAESARQQITEGYDYFKVMADGLENIIDKHVNCLHHEAATVHIANLTEIFQKALTHEDTSTRALIEKRNKEEPQISRKLMPMVLAYEWRFTVLKSLITSSQMQLRVVGATTMCNDLLKLYNQNKVGEPSRNPTLVFLANFVLHHKLIDYLVSIGSHPEIINESHNILGFLIVTKTYPAELTDRIWNTITTSQDPRVVEAILRMIQQCSNLYEYSALLYFCEKLNGLPLASFNASMREFCGIMFQQLVSKASLESHPFVDAPPYILCVRLIRESSILTPQAPNGYPDIQNFAATRFLELLGGGPDTKNRSDIYEGCIEDISLKAPTAPGSICVLHALIQQNADDLASLTKEYGLTQLLVEELELRHNETQSSLFRNSPVNVARRGIICEIISRQADTITPDLGRRLWNHLVGIDSTTDLERAYSWAILNKTNKAHPRNSYIRTCFEEHLPNLPPQCFTDGALEFCRSAVTSWLASIKNKHIDDGFSFDSAGLEQLWRMILFAPSHTIDAKAISIIVEVYLESQFVKSLPRADAKGIHLALVKRCLKQLAAAASRLKTFSDGVSSGEEDGMVIVPSETQFIEQEQIFARSLAVLREFLKVYQAKPQFAAAKPRPFVPVKPSVAQGEPLTVKYQSFDGNVSTEVKELHLGKLNTTAALLASLQQATGFQNYSIYLAGQPFTPDETALSKSLDDLRLTSLVLVKRQDGSLMSPGNHEASLEMEIMKHFEELWGYLGMQEKVAKEIYTFLIKFPVYDRLLQDFDSETSYTEIFPRGQPFRCLYAIHTLREYMARKSKQGEVNEAALARAISLIVAAISDANILAGSATEPLTETLAIHLVDCLIQFLKEPVVPTSVAPHLDATLLERLLSLIGDAESSASAEGSVKLTCGLFEALLETSLHKPQLWEALASHLQTNPLLHDLLLRDTRPAVRKHVAKQIVSKCTFSPSLAQVSTSDFLVQFWPLVQSLIPSASRYAYQCEEVFLLAHTLLKRLAETTIESLKLGELVNSWGIILIQHKCIETIGHPECVDPVAQGLINLLYCAASFAKASHQPLSCSEIGYELLCKHLFPETHLTKRYYEDQAFTPSIPLLNPINRHTLSETIFLLVKDDREEYEKTLQYLFDLVPYDGAHEESPYIYELPFLFDRAKSIRSHTGYVGLRNLSNTCYLNSLFTQLFMNIPFREFMINAQNADEGASQKLLYETQLLFSNMQNSLVRFVDPQNLAASIRTYDETAIDVSIQMDVDEFYNLLFDRWEGQILAPEAKKDFRAFYSGQLVQQVKSKECPHISERLETFSAIQCDIKGKTSLQESLQAYVDGEILEGDNKYKCSTCDRHVDAVKRACLKDVPDNLIFHLKRFDFNLRTLQRSKINDHFAFPTKIDMRPYQVEYLMDNPEEVAEDVFELVGVLVHSGTAESGHYYSFIRERPSMGEKDTWVEFNDDSVSSWDPSLMEHATFGGFEFRGDGNVSFDKSYSAYMLFYQRSSVVAAQQQALVKSQKASPVRTPLPPVISNHIALDNELLMRKYCIYDPSQIQLATKMLYQVRNLNGGQCSEQHLVERKALFMALNHLDQVVTRTKDLPDFPNFMMMIKQMCSSCVECTRDYLEWYCSYPETLRYMLLRNPDSVVRNEVAASILQALQKVKSDLPYAYGLGGDDASIDEDEVESDDPRILQKIVVCLHKLWDIFQSNCRAWPEYFGLLSSIATLGAPEAVLLLDAGYLKKTLEVVSADSALPLTPQLSRMLAIVSKRFSTRPVQFDAVIALLWNLMSVCDRGSDVLQDNVSRFGLLADEESRVPFNIGERDLFCQRWTRSNVLILVEKLLILNQNTTNSHQIIAALMSWDEDDLDPCIYAAISSGIKRVSTTTPAGSYLRAAVVYCKHTETNKATHLLDQIIRCARDVDNSDGREFLRFFKQIVRVSTSERSHVQPEDLHNHVLRSVGMWAPPLLTYYDAPIRVETEEFLTEFILSHGPDVDFGTSHEAEEKASIITEAGQKLGIACLKYLDDTFVRVRQQAVRSALVSILSIIENCEPFFDEDQGDAHSHQYFDLRSTVPNNLKKLTVEEADEELSDWQGSDDEYDSEPMGGSITELGNAPIDDLIDADVPL